MADHAHPVDPDRVELAQRSGLPAGEAQAMAGLLTLLADPLRARILHSLLLNDEMCVGDLAIALGASEDAVSYALRILRTAGLVHRRREGRMGYYRLRDGAAQEALRDSIDRLRHLTSLHLETSADPKNTRVDSPAAPHVVPRPRRDRPRAASLGLRTRTEAPRRSGAPPTRGQ